jgi:hypothetical protein
MPDYGRLRGLTDEQLIEAHDRLAEGTIAGTGAYIAELERRERDRQAAQMMRLTRSMARLTWVMAALTLISAAAAVVALVRA